MTASYFPYSQLVQSLGAAIREGLANKLGRQGFFSEWQVAGNDTRHEDEAINGEISELYY